MRENVNIRDITSNYENKSTKLWDKKSKLSNKSQNYQIKVKLWG